MELIAHRGLWTSVGAPNDSDALLAALEGGFGVETDLRDRDGDVVISHDPATGGEQRLAELLRIYAERGYDSTLALNVKSDGLASRVAELLSDYSIANYFLFDMSVPDHISYLRLGLKTLVRMSEFESLTPLADQASGIWLDGFQSDWFCNAETLLPLLEQASTVCIVSPELHGRSQSDVWNFLRQVEGPERTELMLCTDYPIEYCETKCV